MVPALLQPFIAWQGKAGIFGYAVFVFARQEARGERAECGQAEADAFVEAGEFLFELGANKEAVLGLFHLGFA